MDAHQAYCLNLLVLARRWGRSPITSTAAWALSAIAIALTVVAAWSLGELLARGPTGVDLGTLNSIEAAAVIVATIANYMRFFRFVIGANRADPPGIERASAWPGRAAFAACALIGPAAVVVLVVALAPRPA